MALTLGNGTAVSQPAKHNMTSTSTSTSADGAAVSQAARITKGGAEYIEQALPVLTAAFRDDPVFQYFMGALSVEERRNYLPVFLRSLCKASVLNKGFIFELSSWGCCAVVLPPGKKVDNPFTMIQAGLIPLTIQLKSIGMKRVLFEHGAAVKRVKKKAFASKEKYWYLFIIGTDPNRQRQGLGATLLEHVKALAQRDGRPVWLEASNPNARLLYLKQGFEDVEKFTLGEGLVGPDGLEQEGGSGVPSWGMIWRPASTKKVPSSV
ncbi:hypothetical protein F4808DRAFT_340836 [Astrocystis sublimbata]|nr:hypothetical protein F4808DRAFT_340836 [Astrocystis sublimbata]